MTDSTPPENLVILSEATNESAVEEPALSEVEWDLHFISRTPA